VKPDKPWPSLLPHRGQHGAVGPPPELPDIYETGNTEARKDEERQRRLSEMTARVKAQFGTKRENTLVEAASEAAWLPEPKDPKPVPQHHTERWEQVDEQDNEGERGDE
jgi:hypothetical protein